MRSGWDNRLGERWLEVPNPGKEPGVSNSNREDTDTIASDRRSLDRERYELLQRLNDWLEAPMVFLAFAWLTLLIVELTWGESLAFEVIGTIIWVIFLVDFAIELTLAPRKAEHLKANWLSAVSLLLPALRIFRVFRLFRLFKVGRVGRSLRLFRVVSSLNRGMRALAASLRRRAFGYVVSLTLMIMFAGAAGMYAFERDEAGGLGSYGEALWWTAMVMTTMGSQYWPQTLEGRLLCLFLSLYAFAVFGYVTAALATFFVGRDAESDDAEMAGAAQLAAIREELRRLREDVRALPPASTD
jgi:voltage-gated potassium channel